MELRKLKIHNRKFEKFMRINTTLKTNNTKVELKFDETNITEKNLAIEIRQLESEVEDTRNELQNGIKKELITEINNKTAEIAVLKTKLRFETQLKEKYWKSFKESRYKSKITVENFSRLWNEKLRDEAMKIIIKQEKAEYRLTAKHLTTAFGNL